MYAETNKQLTCGEFCYLPATLCPFPEKVASQNSTQRKDNKVGNKTGCKKGRQKGKMNARKEYWKQILPPPPPPSRKKKKDKLCLEMLERQKFYYFHPTGRKICFEC